VKELNRAGDAGVREGHAFVSFGGAGSRGSLWQQTFPNTVVKISEKDVLESVNVIFYLLSFSLLCEIYFLLCV
jgi:hypothetical protein